MNGMRHYFRGAQDKLLWCMALMAVVYLMTTTGCVRRRLTIRSDPPGATVYVDQREIGVTPVSTPFTYYGTRNFVVTKDGYETVQASRTFRPPWYQWPVLDFISENLWPRELRDERVVEFQLVPKATVSPEKLRQRAEELRRNAATGITAPLPSVTHPGTGRVSSGATGPGIVTLPGPTLPPPQGMTQPPQVIRPPDSTTP